MHRFILCLVTALCLSCLAAPAAGEKGARGPLVGQLLVASPSIGDPHFAGTVILMVEQSPSGALGIAINRPLGDQSAASVLDAIGIHDKKASGTIRLYAGGPVEPQLGFILHSPDYKTADTQMLGNGIALTTTPEIIHDIARKKGPQQTLVAFGYVGWGPGQLDAEITRHDWANAPADAKLVFVTERGEVWRIAWGRRMVAL